jgi:activating signal cointegrator 1
MKCLSIRQPWALLVCVGARTIENRTWNTSYRGEIAIHASGYEQAIKHFMKQETWDASISDRFSLGAIIGVAELYDTMLFDEHVWDDPCAEGPVCFLFRNARLFITPIPHKGRVNLCELPVEVAMRVEEAKADRIDVQAEELRQQCLRAIPPGTLPKSFLPREPRWWSA